MKVMFVSLCTKNALTETRRIIDQFAERKGDCVWQTEITEQGLETVRKLLKASARRNTAVACHLFKGRQHTELLWIVGNIRQFNRDGTVPTNVTAKDILRSDDENNWHTGEAIAILAALSGLFHDFGKANQLFQNKLKGLKNSLTYEPYRHEWISLLLFKAFVGESKEDQEWLERLARISFEDEKDLLDRFNTSCDKLHRNPLKDLDHIPIAKFVGWLILSHHRLPCLLKGNEPRPHLDHIEKWMERGFNAQWNSYNCKNKRDGEVWSEKELKLTTQFSSGTPIRSHTWLKAAQRTAARASKYYDLLKSRNWFHDRFSMHLARASLMLADHCYSADKAHKEYQDPKFKVYANTQSVNKSEGSKAKRILKQQLDEHNVGVATHAYFIAKRLPDLYDSLPCISAPKAFRKRSADPRFAWQDKAYDLACTLKKDSHDNGFFGVNLASTGCGKTLANARIIYGLSDEKQGCRFSIALGLRVLTLQTGEALKEKLFLKSDDVAVMIGSKAFQQLFESNKENKEQNALSEETVFGSESAEELLDEHDYINYDGAFDDGLLKRWFHGSPKLRQLISAPILVSTIDHLMPATEGCRGGKQIAPLLRLLTSDLIIDEPDDFDINDLHALCRLVNMAGVCGCRVLISSATLPPSLTKALFEAYAADRKSFNKARRLSAYEEKICCCWFDEYGVSYVPHKNGDEFMVSHEIFIEKRIKRLKEQQVLRRAHITAVTLSKSTCEKDEENRATAALAEAINETLYGLHNTHHQEHPHSSKKVSFGLMRMANIDPMVEVAKKLLSSHSRPDYCIHFCIYHSQFPLLIRSKIEELLDRTLSRKDAKKIWTIVEVNESLAKSDAKNHLFIVFATPVAEVGRDHDYDWAILEPSSMRSIIQLAGRVQRHRRIEPKQSNISILQYNRKGLLGKNVAFHRPGFESESYKLETKDISFLLSLEQYEQVSAIPRLLTSQNRNFANNLVDLEHERLHAELYGSSNEPCHASLWWNHNVDWCAELQHRKPFRKKAGEEREYVFYLEDEGEEPKIHELEKGKRRASVNDSAFEFDDFTLGQGVYHWINGNIGDEIEQYARQQNGSIAEVSLKFARFTLRAQEELWYYDPTFGFYNKIRS